MTLVGFLILLIIAALCGAAGQALGGYSRGGCLLSIVLGFLGAFVGTRLAGELGLPALFSIDIQGESFPVIWSVVGAALVSLVFGLLSSVIRRR